jgi:hypothetical protein
MCFTYCKIRCALYRFLSSWTVVSCSLIEICQHFGELAVVRIIRVDKVKEGERERERERDFSPQFLSSLYFTLKT